MVFDFQDLDDSIPIGVNSTWKMNALGVTNAQVYLNPSTQMYVMTYKIVDNKKNVICPPVTFSSNDLSSGNISNSRTKLFKKGDLNYDGHLTSDDVTIIQQMDAGVTELSDLQNVLGDMNDDGTVNLIDAFIIMQNYD